MKLDAALDLAGHDHCLNRLTCRIGMERLRLARLCNALPPDIHAYRRHDALWTLGRAQIDLARATDCLAADVAEAHRMLASFGSQMARLIR